MKQMQSVPLSIVADASMALPLQDELGKTVKQRYSYWRLRILYSMIFGYAAFYMVRLNLSVAWPAISAEFGYTKTQYGDIIFIWSIVYGVGKFVNGYFSDRSNARYFMAIGLLGAAISCCLMGFGTSLYYFSFFWAINAWFQSMGWPPVARLLTHWFSPAELGTKWGITNSSHQIGGAIIGAVAGYLVQNHGWQSAFIIPAIFVVGVVTFLFNRLRDTPQSIGLPSIEQHKGLTNNPMEKEEEHLAPKELILRIMNNKLLWYVCLGNMFLYAVRMGIFNWAPTFLKEMTGASLVSSGLQLSGYELAGIPGGFIAGWASDRFFSGRRGPVSVIYMALLTACLFYFWWMPTGNLAMNACVMMAVGFLVYGPQVLAGVAAADFASKKAVGMANGLTGTFGYLGSALSGLCVGRIADHYGWSGGFVFFIAASFLATFFFSLTWNNRAKVLEEQAEAHIE